MYVFENVRTLNEMKRTVEMKMVLVGSRRIGKDRVAELIDMTDHSIMVDVLNVVNVRARMVDNAHRYKIRCGREWEMFIEVSFLGIMLWGKWSQGT